MKNKVLLMFLAIGGLLISAHTSYAASSSNPEITNLSRTISELTNLTPANQGLVEVAIQRALIVKDINRNGQSLKDNDAGISFIGVMQTNSISGTRNSGSSRSTAPSRNERSTRIQIQHILSDRQNSNEATTRIPTAEVLGVSD